MLVVITYDVNTMTFAGEKRLQKSSKIVRAVWCESAKFLVFEVWVDATQLTALKHELSKRNK